MKSFHTEKAPAAVGPYVQAIGTEEFVFTSGQIPLNPENGELVTEISAAARQSLNNIKAILEESGSSLDKVIKCTVFLADINDFAAVNEVYKEFFDEHKPARSAIQVAALPLGAPLEIEAIASL
ncbi:MULTISPECIES: RidA family protein [Anaerococcus]|jgi:putative endoribonuclease L-PSP|uniref:Reactive intermediate deaminase TdcF n=1 Tax=Anaerococcus octavius TaxID=54007 RepID=A0A380WSW1_9FIRM|nr:MULTISPECIES: RidA family protein [Anaerococcus]MDU0894736.1 RidA family protein [Anaerococcus sp.]MDU4026366.1 RidA family protein [Anaerococcus sp.]MDU5534678.1 RidA family protein [Anaerococcus sp.]SUU91963.1 Putative reactive intermediate deaminase TdcF [Anaerococcus octavius]